MKKNQILIIGIVSLLLATAINFNAKAQVTPNPKPFVQPNKLPIGYKLPPVDSMKLGIDLAVTSIKVKVIKKISEFKAQIAITATVTNIGLNEYISNGNQQQLLLYSDPQGGATTLVATKDFGNLAKGKTVSVTYNITWDKAIEFAPDYTGVLAFDPDIYIDNNPKNDDINAVNNTRTLTGLDINKTKW